MKKTTLSAILLTMALTTMTAQTKLTLNIDKATKAVTPTLYGLMTEEINYSYEGGLYAQLIRDPQFTVTATPKQAFRPIPTRLKYWTLSDTVNATISILYNKGVNAKNNAANISTKVADVNLLNDGYWGIAMTPDTQYKGSFYAQGGHSITIKLESADSKTLYAQTTVNGITSGMHKYEFTLNTGNDFTKTNNAQFKMTFNEPGNYVISNVTLFPPTYNNRENGMRSDLMTMMKNMRPKFLRFPGGNYVEGGRFCERFDWKSTIGKIEERPGHQSPWGYWSTDGMGLLEFLQWAEDVGAEPILAVFAGYTLNGDYVEGDALQPYIQDALDEIEYVTGDASTKWGAQRIKDGHPTPFPLHYVEIGNEDFFDVSGSYSHRYQQIYEAIKAKYPQLSLISTVDEASLKSHASHPDDIRTDVIDEHYYRSAADMYRAAFQYDTYDRKGPKIFCGEWATREGEPTTNMNAALGDAAWMTCMERNSDLLIGGCYAPLFVNVNPGGMQWQSDLIGYNTLSAYGSPSYYAQVMFGNHVGDRIIPVESENIPTFTLTDKRGGTVPEIYCSATKDSKTGRIYLKIVNVTGNSNKVNIALKGAVTTKGKAMKLELKSQKPEDTNTIGQPTNITPVKTQFKASKNFKLNLSPYSITILLL